MHEDIKWLFGLLLVFAAIWFSSGGLNKLSNKNPLLDPVIKNETEDSDTTDFAYIGKNSSAKIKRVTIGSNTQNSQANRQPLTTEEEIAQGLKDAGIKAEKIRKELLALEEDRYASPLKNKLSISNINRGTTIPVNEYIVIKASTHNTEKILITGMRIESVVTGKGSNIGKAAPIIFQNQINQEEPVYLAPGEIAYIITGRSPIGVSFRPNMCTGFLTQRQTFSPSIPARCPRPSEKDLPDDGTQYNDACRNYINSLSACRVVVTPPLTLSPECQRYVTTEINYTKCVEKNKNKSNFYDNNWRVYLNRTETLWKTSRELIRLVDQNGKIIDAITY